MFSPLLLNQYVSANNQIFILAIPISICNLIHISWIQYYKMTKEVWLYVFNSSYPATLFVRSNNVHGFNQVCCITTCQLYSGTVALSTEQCRCLVLLHKALRRDWTSARYSDWSGGWKSQVDGGGGLGEWGEWRSQKDGESGGWRIQGDGGGLMMKESGE